LAWSNVLWACSFLTSEGKSTVTKLEMVQQAVTVRGEATAEEIAAFIEHWHGVKIEPKYIPIYRATIKDKLLLEEKRRAAQAMDAQKEADAKPEEKAA
jgi:hypothetical protein